MTAVKGPLGDRDAKVTGEALQGALVDVLDLSLTAKQAHWNLQGRHFRSLHLQLDEVVASARGYADQVAERAAAVDVPPDGRASTAAAATTFPLPDGWLQDHDVVDHLAELLAGMIERMRERITTTGESDPVSQDLLLALTADLEKHAWMIRAQR